MHSKTELHDTLVLTNFNDRHDHPRSLQRAMLDHRKSVASQIITHLSVTIITSLTVMSAKFTHHQNA
jgi:hypothetical protein